MATGDESTAALDLGTLDLSTVDPQEFARIVRTTPIARTTEVMAGPHRRRVLDELFRRMAILFKPGMAGDRQVMIRWCVTAADGPADTYETDVADGRLTVTPHATDRSPRLTLTMAAPELLKLASGSASGPLLLITRKLDARGDLLLAASMTRWFDLPGV